MGLTGVAAAATLVGETVQYEVRSASSNTFGSGSAVVGTNVEFIVDAAADIGFSDGMIAVDISDSSILFRGPTTPNTFRFGYESIRVFSLDYQPQTEILSITTTVDLADPLGLNVTFGPHEVELQLGNSLWVPGAGDSVRVHLIVRALFLASFTGTCRTTNEHGRIVSRPFNTETIVEDCAAKQQPPLDPRALALVYDPAQDEFKVLNRTNGAVLCDFLQFKPGATVTSANGKRVERQVFVSVADEPTNITGSAVVVESAIRDADHNVSRFNLHGSFQAGKPATENSPAKVYSGRFSVSRKFVPLSRP
jgi:hypothetical protein